MSHVDEVPLGLTLCQELPDRTLGPETMVGQVPRKNELNSSQLFPGWSRFPLGRRFGLVSTMGKSRMVPWGLSLASVHAPIPMGDLSRFSYDAEHQIGVVREGGRVVPLCKHTDGPTRSVTHPDGHKGNDADDDWRED